MIDSKQITNYGLKFYTYNSYPIKNDDQISYILDKFIEDPYLLKNYRFQADYIKAVLICQDRYKNSTYLFAQKIFNEILANSVDANLLLNAEYQLTLMKAKGLIYTTDYDSVAKSLLRFFRHKDCSVEMQLHAAFHLAVLAINDCTTKISKENAIII